MNEAVLRVGESATFPVDAAKWWNPSGIHLEARATYRYEMPAGEQWCDWKIFCGPEGYASPNSLLSAWESGRRIPAENWFRLIGSIRADWSSQTNLFPMETTTFVPLKSGELTCFANDLWWMYWNNRGILNVTVTRIA